ncbi:MAG: hypothetical protein VXZ38_12140 [Planctomycetota bacterium]|nr:hypothetical protein [Planctomycetota bacterium]
MSDPTISQLRLAGRFRRLPVRPTSATNPVEFRWRRRSGRWRAAFV